MKLRQMAVAFLYNKKEEILFLQKKKRSALHPGLLVPIGGHIEGDEINEPKKACLREIEEETGLKSHCIKDLTLRYIVLRVKSHQEVRIQYVFNGTVSEQATLIESEEGSLSWLSYEDIILNHNVTATTKEIVNHYDRTGKFDGKIYVGSMTSIEGKPDITWGLLEDWEPQIFN
ncbi:NUDIX domain-containing protein [Gracilibacillus caseinilyticus]|uniref:NUDIX domain-containing protein n=1 Tax=Gracilibacillus caseinilyticus TaxID=2932256 RepID=A0ABY4ESZ4_9BACI|nr:NUDIX domain-containing protein [Gracilibacillus caseinilyticus]UOQ46847.1 NUDIX domain-containing protein [Gracilibacillus caseinilyticus]